MGDKDQQARVERELLREGAEREDVESSWRIFRIMAEFVEGFELLQQYGRAATIFGTSRCGAGDEVYEQARALAARLAADQFAIITGGGGGVMEAANRGAYEAGGRSVGMNIKLPAEQAPNRFVHDSADFHYFFTRKVMLSFASEAYIFFPGGFGTLDEFFEMVTLVQTDKIKRIPVILVGRDYWEPLLTWVDHTVLQRYGAISEADKKIYYLVDSVDEAADLISELVPEDAA